MDDQKQIQLLQDAITAYENGAIIEAKDMAIEFINNITDFEAESEDTHVPDTNVGKLDGDSIDIDKEMDNYKKTLELIKGIDLEVGG